MRLNQNVTFTFSFNVLVSQRTTEFGRKYKHDILNQKKAVRWAGYLRLIFTI